MGTRSRTRRGDAPIAAAVERPTLLGSAAAVAWAAATMLEEVASGRRPPRQLRAVLRADVAERWTRMPVRPGSPGRVVRVAPPQISLRCSDPSAEVVVLVEGEGRLLPTALRLEHRGGRWEATDVARPGRDQPPPLPTTWSRLLTDEDALVPSPALPAEPAPA